MHWIISLLCCCQLLINCSWSRKVCQTNNRSDYLVLQINRSLEKSDTVIADLNDYVDSDINLELSNNSFDYFRLNPINKQLVLRKSFEANRFDEFAVLLGCSLNTSDETGKQGILSATLLSDHTETSDLKNYFHKEIHSKRRIVRQAGTSGDGSQRPPSFVHPSCDRLFNGVCANVEYAISIKAGLMPGIQPLSVQPNSIQAQDLDSRNIPVRYAFVNGTPSNFDTYFFIDSQSGAISQLRPVPISTAQKFYITISASKADVRSMSSLARLVVDVDGNAVNLFAPVLQSSGTVGYIEENSETGAIVRVAPAIGSSPLQILVTDEDLKPGMPPATYQYILTGLGASVFAVNQGGYVYLNAPTLDADSPSPSSYQLTLQAREVGTSPVRSSEPLTLNINVVDINDNAPTFPSQSYQATAFPNVNQQDIMEVRAVDNDKGKFGEIVYRIASVSNDGDAFFRYNKDTGYLVAIAPLTSGSKYQIVLEAIDGDGKSSQTTISVDVNINSSSQSISSIFRSTTGPNSLNGSNTNFAPVSSNFDGTISAEYNVSVSENAPLNSIVMTLGGSLSGSVTYSILRGNEDEKFKLDREMGVLTTNSRLDRETKSFYRLFVQIATTNGNATIAVNVNVADDNDNAPRILNASPIAFQVLDGMSNIVVGQIRAEDSDLGRNGEITFSISTPNKKFAIDSKNGTIFAIVALNRSEGEQIFNVIAKDSGNPSQQTAVQVTVHVVDSVNEAPYFPINYYNVSIEEKSKAREILRVQALHQSSASGPITYELRKGDPSLFAVDSLSGAISTLDILDAEQSRTHTLIVGTKQNRQSTSNATATVVVTVEDINDWVPLFRQPSYTVTINDDLPPSTPITQVTAEDNDVHHPNNIVRYQITGFGQAKDYFKIDPVSGLISVAKTLYDAPKPDLIILVEAKDNGSPSLSSTATVAVTLYSETNLLSVNRSVISNGSTSVRPSVNHQIRFTSSSSSASVSESVAPPYFVQILSVEDKPINRDGIQCSIVSGNYAETFSISVNSEGNCELRTQKTLDREKIDQYVLNISVSSPISTPGGSHTDFGETTIFIIDTNDNGPQFRFDPDNLGHKTYYGALDINAKEFSSILTVEAHDSDLGNSGQISYLIPTNESDGKYFLISPTGEIKNIKIFATITDKSDMLFQFNVEARDNPLNDLPKSSFANVIINGITNAHRFVMVLEGILPDQAYKYIPNIKKSLQNRTGNCKILGYESIRESSTLAAEEKPGTEIAWYAIDPNNGLICRRDQFSQLFDEDTTKVVRGELDTYFKLQSLKPLAPAVATAGLFSSDKWQAAEIALIVLACVIAIGAIIGILSMCYFWSRYKASRRSVVPVDRMHLYAALPKYNALLVPNSEKEYETQMLQMAMAEESEMHRHQHHGGDADFSIEEGIYTIQSPNRFDIFAQQQPPSHVYIPPPDYPVNGGLNGNLNGMSNGNSLQRFRFVNSEKTTIL